MVLYTMSHPLHYMVHIFWYSHYTTMCIYLIHPLHYMVMHIFCRPCIQCGAYFLLHPVYYLVHIFWYTLYSTGSWELKYTVFSLYTDLSKCLNHCNYTPPPFLHLPSSPLLSQIQICISFLTPPPPHPVKYPLNFAYYWSVQGLGQEHYFQKFKFLTISCRGQYTLLKSRLHLEVSNLAKQKFRRFFLLVDFSVCAKNENVNILQWYLMVWRPTNEITLK